MGSNVTIVIQARMSSTRLPGKVLVDFLGMPLAVLAARRAATRGHRVVVATSVESSDDALAETCARHGIACVRGPLNDVLGRFVLALEGCDDDDVVVRLTADNIVPDGDLVAEVVEDFQNRGLDYMFTTDVTSGLPYGCSVEVTRVGLIRRAASEATTDFEREHVTPWIRARCPETVFTRYAGLGRGHFRCTIDCLDDYVSLVGVFPRAVDPVHAGWLSVVNALVPGQGQPSVAQPATKLVLGTAQLGMPYGIVSANVPDAAEGARMIKTAILNGARWLDTARAYGQSEDVIGRTLASGWAGRCRVVTKLAPLDDCPADADPALARAMAENSLNMSCRALRQTRLDAVLLHRARHLTMWNGAALEVLRDWRERGGLDTIGVSVQSPEELMLAMSFDEVAHVQIPFNVLDRRWGEAIETLRQQRLRRPLVVHVRSVFLQGLLLSDSATAWARAHVSDATPIRRWLREQAARCGHADVAAFCIAHARSQDWIDGLVIGSDSVAQLLETVTAFDQPLLSSEQLVAIERSRPEVDLRTLDPATWKPAREGRP